MSQENVEIARRMNEYYNARDVHGCVRLAVTDIVFHPGEGEPETGPMKGSREWGDYLRSNLEVFPQYEVEASEYVDLGEFVVVVGSVRGRGRVSGVEVHSDEVWLWRFRDGKAVEYWECGTKEQALEAAGLSE
ncbi:MAG: nuclear transport factor 2 family protein [Thermoleophilaceae bacterium]